MKRKSLTLIVLAVLLFSAFQFSMNIPLVHADAESLSEDFEDWNSNSWSTGQTGSQSDETSIVYAGSHSRKFVVASGQYAQIYKEIGTESPHSFSYRIYLPTDISMTGSDEFLNAYVLNDGAELAIGLYNDGGTIKVYSYSTGGDGSIYHEDSVSKGSWHLFRGVMFEGVAGVGYVEIYLDGSKIYNYTATNDALQDALPAYDPQYFFGLVNSGSLSAGTVYLDNINVGDAVSVSADLEPDETGVNWVFTDWRYYTFTVTIPSSLYSGDLDYVYLGFTEILTSNGTNGFASWTDGSGWECAFTYSYESRELDPIRVKAGSWSNSSEGSSITFPLWFTDACLDIWLDADAVDVLVWFNDTSGSASEWNTIESDYFRIYNDGGFSSESGYLGNAGVLPGGRDLSMFAYNGSYAYKSLRWRDLQHIKLQPVVHFKAGLETFQVYYELNFITMDGEKHYGIKLRLEPDVVAYTGVFASDVWINMSASWYYNDTFVTSENLYMFYHGDVYTATDPGRWSFWVDLWFDNTNASSVVGGRVNAYEYPMNDNSAVWFRWLSSNWGVKDDVEKQSEFFYPLLDTAGNRLTSEQIQFVEVRVFLGVNDEDAGQYVAIPEYNTFDSTLGGSPLKGISTPPWDETNMPAMKNVGVLGAIWSMFQGIGKWLSEEVLFGGLNLWGTFVAFLDTIAGWLGAPHFFSNLFDWIGDGFAYLSASAGYAWEILANIFILIGSLLAGFVVTIGELIGSFVNTISMFVDFMGGGLGAAGNLWDQLGISTWITVAIIFYPLYLIILWEQKGMDAVIQQLTWIFGIMVWLYHFFVELVQFIIRMVTAIIESIPVAE